MTIFNDDSKGKSSLQHPVHLSLTFLTLTSSINTLTFLCRSNELVTGIGFLEAGLVGLVFGLGIGRKGLRKTWEIFAIL
jgi:hypothetical protein